MSAAVMVTVLVAGGIYLILQRGLVRAALGFVLIGHAANVIILAAGGMDRREAAYVGDGMEGTAIADPLLQAFALTAIVITFALTVYLFALAGHGGDDDGPASDAPPSDAGQDGGTVIDSPPPGSRGDQTPGEPTEDRPVGTHSTGDQPTGRTHGREHA